MRIEKSALMNVVSTVMHSVSTNNIKPALNGILFKSQNGVLELQTTDLEMATKCSVDVEEQEEFEFIIDAKLINNVVKSLPDQTCEIKYDGNNVYVSSGKSRFKLNTIKGDEFPSFVPASDSGYILELNTQLIKNMIDKVIFCAAIDKYMTNLYGVYWEFYDSILRLVAADGFRLGYVDTPLERPFSEKFSFILSLKTMKELQKILNTYPEEYFVIIYDTSKVSFKLKNTHIVARIVEAEFPNYRNILSTEYQTKITATSTDLIKTIKQVSVLADEAIKLRIEDGVLTAEAQLPDFGEATAELMVDLEGENQYLAINPTFLINSLSTIPDDVELLIKGATSPIQVKPIDKDTPVYIIMPIRL